MAVYLRPYQKKAIENVERLEKKTNKQALVLATGLGKTVIFANIIKNKVKNLGKKALVLAHREELLEQAKDKIQRQDEKLSVAIEQANRKATSEDVVVASVPTIGRKDSNRITKFDPRDFGVIVIDEAHHASASTYQNILDYFGVLKGGNNWNKDILLLGVTATPNRNDNKGIDEIFDETAFTYGILEGIQDGWLSHIRAFRVDTATELQGLKNQSGDFVVKELSDRINNEERNKLIVKTYKEVLDGKQALIFAADVRHAQALEKEFSKAGIKSGYITGETKNRQELLAQFYNKEIQVIVNCMVLTEGYDNPSIDAIMMARPTQSSILYQQMVGRGTRILDGKPHLTVVDFVDNTLKHPLKTASSLLGLEGKVNFRGKDILEVKGEIDKVQELNPNYSLDNLDIDRIKYIMEEVDLLAGLDIPEQIRSFTQFNWYRFGVDTYRINLGDQQYVIVSRTVTGQYKAFFDVHDGIMKRTYRQELGEKPTLKEVVERADKYISDNYKQALPLVSKQARWRKEKITEKQVKWLWERRGKYAITEDLIAKLDKGTASDLMTKIINMNEKRYK